MRVLNLVKQSWERAAACGVHAVIEATGPRSEKNAFALIDPAILERARENDAAPAPAAAGPR